MAEDNKGAPKNVSDSKNDRGGIPARYSSSGPQGRQASEREGASKDKTDSGHAPGDARKLGSSGAAPATNKSEQQETVSTSTPGVTSPWSNTPAKTLSSPCNELGANSERSPESPSGISEAERRLAELTVLRGRKMPLDQSELPLSPMLQRGPPASKGRRVSIDMQPTIGLISPRSALRSPDTGLTSPSQEGLITPTTEPATPLLTAVAKEGERQPSASSIRSSLSSGRKASTDSQKRAVVYPPVLKVRGSSTSAGTEGSTEPGPSAPPDQTP